MPNTPRRPTCLMTLKDRLLASPTQKIDTHGDQSVPPLVGDAPPTQKIDTHGDQSVSPWVRDTSPTQKIDTHGD